MMYLTEVRYSARFGQKAKGFILGRFRFDGFLVSCPGKTIELPSNHPWQAQQLLLVEMSLDGTIDEVTHATDKVVQMLREYSAELAGFSNNKKAKEELDLTRESLEFQSRELFDRNEELKQREELLRQQEELLAVVLYKMSLKLEAIEEQHAALTSAWRHLHYRENQLEERQLKKQP